MAFKVPEQYRVQGLSLPAYGNNGVFQLRKHSGRRALRIIASDGALWEHVSVSTPGGQPTWKEMCHVKALFWGPEDCVVQYHPPASEYVNIHPNCLHLWRPIALDIPRPPGFMV